MKASGSIARWIAKWIAALKGHAGPDEIDPIRSKRIELEVYGGAPNQPMHQLEAEQEARVVREEARQEGFSDHEYNSYLERKYGTTSWAKRLIAELTERRRLFKKQGKSSA